jgi:enterochelin esterase family protein
VALYHPPTDEPCPLVVVFDGPDYVQRAHLPTMMDNLIAEKRIRPVALALVAHGRQARIIEYMTSDATLIFLMTSVLPLARQHLNLADEPGIHGVLGASMGGLMALYTGLRLPDIFGRVISESASLGFSDDQGHEMMIFDLVRWGNVPPVKVWLSVGTLEPLLQPVRRMRHLMNSKGYDVTYRESGGGHNYTMWADNAWRGLEMMYRMR